MALAQAPDIFAMNDPPSGNPVSPNMLPPGLACPGSACMRRLCLRHGRATRKDAGPQARLCDCHLHTHTLGTPVSSSVREENLALPAFGVG